MALIKCPECGKEVSDKAKACPKCGCPINEKEDKKDSKIKLVAAKCPSCGADIDVDKNENKTKCKFCHSSIMVDEAIEKYQIEISGEIEVSNLPKANSYLKNGARYYENGEYDEAYKQYNKAVEMDPDNYIAVLRNGICNTLDTNYFGYNLNPLQSGIQEAANILNKSKEKVDDINYNQIANEGYKATKLMENFANNFYNKGLCNYKDMIDNLQKLLGCMSVYADCEAIAKDDDIKKKILKSEVELADSMIASRKYRTGRYKNGNEVIGTFVPPRSIEKSLYSMRNEAVEKYNKIVEPSKQLKVKKQPAIRWDGPSGKAIIFIIAFVVIYIFLSSQFGGSSNSDASKSYDYVQDCSGLKTVKLVDIYHEYEKDKVKATEKYAGKAFIFEGKIFSINAEKSVPVLQMESGDIGPEIYFNSSQADKLKKYKSGDKIKVCGVLKTKDTVISVPIYVENATVIK